MDHVRQLLIFATVVNEGSFTAAAAVLGLTKSSVSKQVTALEAHYDVRLLNRTTRSLGLTDAGALVYEKCEAIRELADEATSALEQHKQEPAGLLRVTAALGIGERYLAPRLADFCSRYPKIDLHLTLSDSISTAIPSLHDVAIRAGSLGSGDLVAKKIFEIGMVVVRTPKTDLQNPITDPSELKSENWIGYTPLGTPQKISFSRDGEVTTVQLNARVVSNNGSVIRTMLLSGPFSSLLPKFWVADDLRAGHLVHALTAWSLPTAAVYALRADRNHVPSKCVRLSISFPNGVSRTPTACA